MQRMVDYSGQLALAVGRDPDAPAGPRKVTET